MAVPFDEIKAKLAPEVREEGERMGKELIAEYLTLRELRKARKLSQKDLAERSKSRQAAISKIEKRRDLMLSTLRGYVEAAGGKLEVRAVFPNLRSVIVNIGDEGFSKPKRAEAATLGKRAPSVRPRREKSLSASKEKC